jgi:hypothetical protein
MHQATCERILARIDECEAVREQSFMEAFARLARYFSH